MKEILRFLYPYRGRLLMATVMIALSTVCDLMLPTIMSDILNQGVYASDMDYIVRCCLQMLVVALAGLTTVLLGCKLSADVIAGFCADLRRAVFTKVNGMTFEEFGKLGTAALVTRATHDVETVSWIAAELSGTIVTIPVLFFGGTVLAMRKDVWLSLTLMLFVPLIVWIVLLVGKRILPLWDKSDVYIDRQNDLMRGRLRGIRVIRAFNAEDQEHEKIAESTRIMSQTIITSNVSMGIITPLATFILDFATVWILYLGVFRMQGGARLTGGDMFAIVQYIALISGGILMGAFSVIMFPHAQVAARRIGQVLHAQEMEDTIPAEAEPLTGAIEFRNVSFSYPGAAEPALKNISLRIERGERVAIIGGTGAGKSTVVSMLMRFHSPTTGQVLLDGRPVQELGSRTVRQNISCVLQNASIYSGTIRENLTMGKPEASDLACWEALETAQAKEFVERFSDGLQHTLRQSGKNLSGGQKQRLCIARAVMKDAPIYIFDDSFSALDFLTESRLRQALAKRIAGKTQIVVTQRVTSAMFADRVFVLENGRLVGAGDHASLMKTCPVYQEIVQSQIGGSV